MVPGNAMRISTVVIFVVIFLLMISPAIVISAPASFIREEISAAYFTNGTMDGNVIKIGYVEVDTESDTDVLQTISMELSGTAGTNLQSSTAYKNVAASPYTGDRTRIYVNTTQNPQSLLYNITDPDVAAVLSLKIEYQNSMGGMDIHPGPNTFTFNLTMNTTKDVTNVITNIRFSKDVLGMNDGIDLYNPASSAGSTQIIDSDWDGFYDIVRWQGDMSEGGVVYMTFQGNLTPGVNFDEALMMIDMDQEAQSIAASSQDQTLTGITFIDRFSRGPVREGIEMVDISDWKVRGFIKDVSVSFDYAVYGWDIYRVGEPAPLSSSSTGSYLNPGDDYYTDWYDTASSAKQDYYTSAFDWEVVWGGSQHSGITQSRIYLPVMYEMDFFGDKTVNLNSNTQAGRYVSVTDLLRHLGHLTLNISSVNIMSRLPGTSVTAQGTSWSASNVRVVYSNNTGQYDITSDAVITIQNAVSGTDGYVLVNVTGLQSILGHNLSQNEDILLSYDLSGPAESTTQDYDFVTQGDFITESGTHVIKDFNQTLTIPGAYIPGAPPGGGPGGAYVPPALYAAIEKESSAVRFITQEYVEINVTDVIVDNGDKGVKDIKAMVYIPYDGTMDMDEVHVSIYHSSSGFLEQWNKNSDFTVTNTGVKIIGSQKYTEYVIEKKRAGVPYEETLTLFDGDRINIGFRTRIPVGTNYILTRVFGYNYYEDKLMFEDVYTPVRREGVIKEFEVTEEPWVQEKPLVGKPVVWKKEMVVYNPNNITVEEMITTSLFKDVMSVYLLEYGDGAPVRTKLKLKSDGENTYTDWMAKLDGFRTGIYAIEITTPPVLETKEVVDVLETNETTVTFFLNITLVNFALEDYSNVSFLIPISREKVISIQDDNGPVDFIDNGDGIELLLGSIAASQTMYIYVVYEEIPPVIMTTLDSLNYQCPDYVSGNVFIIPSERERGAYLEMEVMGPDPGLKTVFADLILLDEMREFEEKKVPIGFSASSLASGKYVIYTRFKKDFTTILHHQRDFIIDCPEREIIRISWLIFVAIAALVVGFLVFRIYKKRTYKKELGELKKKIRGI